MTLRAISLAIGLVLTTPLAATAQDGWIIISANEDGVVALSPPHTHSIDDAGRVRLTVAYWTVEGSWIRVDGEEKFSRMSSLGVTLDCRAGTLQGDAPNYWGPEAKLIAMGPAESTSAVAPDSPEEETVLREGCAASDQRVQQGQANSLAALEREGPVFVVRALTNR